MTKLRASCDDRAEYAPLDLVTDPTTLGLITTKVTGPLGSCVARHLPRRTSTRATIFLHGAAGSWTTWTPMIETATASGSPISNPILLDLPGWGDAALTESRIEHTIVAICTLVKDLAEELGYTEWDLVGHSLGGFVALHMARLWPQSVLSVGMVSGTTFSVIRSVEHPVRNFLEVPGFVMLWKVMQFLSLLGAVGPVLVRAIGAIGLLGPLTFPLFRHWRRIPSGQVRALAHEIRPQAFSTAATIARGYDAGAWSSITSPIRATKGDRDVFVSPRDFDRLGELLPDSTRAVIVDCGHFGNVERPREVLIALGFLGATVES